MRQDGGMDKRNEEKVYFVMFISFILYSIGHVCLEMITGNDLGVRYN